MTKVPTLEEILRAFCNPSPTSLTILHAPLNYIMPHDMTQSSPKTKYAIDSLYFAAE